MNTLIYSTLAAIAISVVSVSGSALAADMSGMKMDEGSTQAKQPSASMAEAVLTDAVVKQIDAKNNMITIDHGELKNIGMGSMTMAYQAKDAAMLGSVRAGEKVKVRVENVNGSLTIVKLVKR